MITEYDPNWGDHKPRSPEGGSNSIGNVLDRLNAGQPTGTRRQPKQAKDRPGGKRYTPNGEMYITTPLWYFRLHYAQILTLPANAVYQTLNQRADFREKTCYPTQDQIATEAGLCRRTVSTALAELQLLGLVLTERPGGRNKRTFYTLAQTLEQRQAFADQAAQRDAENHSRLFVEARARLTPGLKQWGEESKKQEAEWAEKHGENRVVHKGDIIYEDHIDDRDALNLLTRKTVGISEEQADIIVQEVDNMTILNAVRNGYAEQRIRQANYSQDPIRNLGNYIYKFLWNRVKAKRKGKKEIRLLTPGLPFCRLAVNEFNKKNHDNKQLRNFCQQRLKELSQANAPPQAAAS